MKINRVIIEQVLFDSEDEPGMQDAALIRQHINALVPPRTYCRECRCWCTEPMCNVLCQRLFEIIDQETHPDKPTK